MTHRYIGTKEITAWEQEKDGQTDALSADWMVLA